MWSGCLQPLCFSPWPCPVLREKHLCFSSLSGRHLEIFFKLLFWVHVFDVPRTFSLHMGLFRVENARHKNSREEPGQLWVETLLFIFLFTPLFQVTFIYFLRKSFTTKVAHSHFIELLLPVFTSWTRPSADEWEIQRGSRMSVIFKLPANSEHLVRGGEGRRAALSKGALVSPVNTMRTAHREVNKEACVHCSYCNGL